LKTLHGLEIDFGYELIDGDWVLEFPGEDQPAKPQPWMVVEQPTTPKPASPAAVVQQAPAGINRYGTSAGTPALGESKDARNAGTGTEPVSNGSANGAGPWRAAAGTDGASGGEKSGVGGSAGPATQNQGAGGVSMGIPAALGAARPTDRPAGVVFG